MSQRTSPSTGQAYGIRLTCRVLDLSRSTYYAQKAPKPLMSKKRGPKPAISDDDLLSLIKEDLAHSSFYGEGHRKVNARLHRSGKQVSRNRVLRIMRSHRLLSPHRSAARTAKAHDGRITTDEPNQMWGTDGLKVLTLREGWVWVFPVVEHWNTECLGFHVTKCGDRFAALAPISSALMKRFGSVERGVAQRLELAVRLDHGSQYRERIFGIS